MRPARPAALPLLAALCLLGCRPASDPAPTAGAGPRAAPPGTAAALPAADDLPEASGRELIEDGGFEGPRPGPWHENNWARNEASFARDEDRPWQGRACQRLQMTRILHEPACELVQPLRGLKPGDALVVRCALRGNPNGRPASVMVRRWAKPWTTLASLAVPVTERWQEVVLPVVVPAGFDSGDLALFVVLHDESALWVDGVSARLLPAVDPRPPQAGNLVANGSFALGTARWVATFRNAGGLDQASAARDRIQPGDWGAVQADGAPALRLVVREGGAVYADSSAFALRLGQAVRLRARVRGPAGGRIQVGVRQADWLLSSTTANPDGGWRTVAVEGVPGPCPAGAFVELHTTSPGEWLVQEVQVEQAPGPARRAFACALPDAPPGRLFRPGEAARLELRVAGAAPGAIAGELRVDDAWDRPVWRRTVAIDAGADGGGRAALDLPMDRFGAFRCVLAVDGAEVAEQLYAVAPALPPPGPASDRFFGGHAACDLYSLDLAERIGFRSLRLMSQNIDTFWAVAEPVEGRFQPPTAPVQRALARGFAVSGVLNCPPEWAAQRTGSQSYSWWHARMPADWARWDAYVRRTVAAFPGIADWEVGNEMDCDYLIVPPEASKPASYAELVQRTRAAVAAAAPHARVVGLGVSNPDRPFWRECLARGIAADLNVIAPHFYFEDLDPLEKRGFVQALADMRAQAGRGGTPPALWMGEGGMWLHRSPSRLRLLGVRNGGSDVQAAAALVRIATAFKALGVERHLHYALSTSPTGSGNVLWRSECNGLVDFDGSARPAAAAHAALVALLEGAAPAGAERIEVDGAAVSLARFDHPRQGRITAAWSRQPVDPARVPGLLAAGAALRDLFGNPLAAAPARLDPEPLFVVGGRP